MSANLRERIRESSLDEVVLEEMIRHGFWDEQSVKSTLPADFIKRKGELQREMQNLLSKDRALADPDRALQLIMKDRMREARLRRVETKRKAIEAKNARGAAFDDWRRRHVTSLGDVSSGPLTDRGADTERLATLGLPAFESVEDIAAKMGIPIAELRFLAFDRKVSKVSHYRHIEIPKKTGGVRKISAPMPRLKRAQYWVLDNILNTQDPHDAAHGFRVGRSILTNAERHVGQDVVVNLDLQDFFPTITYKRLKGLFVSMGYAEAEAAVLGLICTEAERETITVDGEKLYVAQGDRKTPQGAPTSPAIANLVTRRLDKRLTGLAAGFGLTYTRYADDLTFSGAESGANFVGQLLRGVGMIVEDEGFVVHPDKTRIMRKGSRQEVTGLVVNDKVSVPRKDRRAFRAWLHQARQNGGPAKSFRNGNPLDSGRGYASFLHMVGGPEAHRLAEQAWAQLGRDPSFVPNPAKHDSAASFRSLSAAGEAPNEDWKVAQERAEFVPEELPGFDRQDMSQSAAPTTVPRAGRRRGRPERPDEGGGGQTRGTPWSGRRQSRVSKPRKPLLWCAVLSFFALFLFTVPAVGPVLTVAVFYVIWKPQSQRAGVMGFLEKAGKSALYVAGAMLVFGIVAGIILGR